LGILAYAVLSLLLNPEDLRNLKDIFLRKKVSKNSGKGQ